MDIAMHREEKYFRRLHPGSVGWSPSGFFKPDFSPLGEMKISFDPPMQFPLVARNYSIIRRRLLTWEKVTLLHPALATLALKWCPVTNAADETLSTSLFNWKSYRQTNWRLTINSTRSFLHSYPQHSWIIMLFDLILETIYRLFCFFSNLRWNVVDSFKKWTFV